MDSSGSNKASACDGDDHNGQTTSKYSWSQTITDLDVKIPIEPQIQKGKQVIVEIGADSIKVQLIRSVDNANQVEDLVSGSLSYPVKKQDSYWTLSPGKYVSLFLQKQQERWWTALLVGEPEIDMNSIEPVREVADLEEDEQAKIAEMMHNQKQKFLGKPTSDDQKMQDILKQAWDKEGSPFKGQPFDPSLVNFGPKDD